LHSMLQILSVTPFEKIPLLQILTDTTPDDELLLSRSQLNLFRKLSDATESYGNLMRGGFRDQTES